MEGMIGAPWRKSSYSAGNGGDCVEVATWRKTTYSTGNGGGCVEAGVAEPGRVLVRDTTNRDGETLAFSAGAWQEFITSLR